ncbi:hypothetical protein ACFZ8E_19635 [Methylobacterium sp. HMF5984]|uniref:hypothetical protein n=1 Tax=Methylobacterium sp. HMF5984 TaxID=3367370 RepID=UPI00385513B7
MTLLYSLPGCRLIRVAHDGRAALTIIAQARHNHARCPSCRTLGPASGAVALHRQDDLAQPLVVGLRLDELRLERLRIVGQA